MIFCITSKAAPALNGPAMDVPDSTAYVCVLVAGSIAVDVTLSPGAEMSGFKVYSAIGPQEEKPSIWESAPVALVSAATVMADAAAPGSPIVESFLGA